MHLPKRFSLLMFAALVLFAGAVFAVPSATAAPNDAAAHSSTTSPGEATHTVSYAGVTVRVPSGWPVQDLAGKTGCIRYDRDAVFLGEPAVSDCPAGLVGRRTTVQIVASGQQPAGTGKPLADGLTVYGGTSTQPDLIVSKAGSSAQVLITAGGDPAEAEAIAATVAFTGAAPKAAAEAPTGGAAPRSAGTVTTTATAAVAPAGTAYTGPGFDACSAPSTGQMNNWLASPYRAVGVYIGGVNRGCSQPNLTAGWVSSVRGSGWHLLPIYVGLQAPCTTFSQRFSQTPSTAATQGTAAANDAANQMAALGLAPSRSNPIYFDLENYAATNAACAAAVKAFMNAWTVRVNARGYLSGAYGNSTSLMTNLVHWVGTTGFHAPNSIWYARWDGIAATGGDPAIPDSMWRSHQRVHQYHGPVNQTYGTTRINIDQNQVDGATTGTLVSTTTLTAGVAGSPYSGSLAAAGTGPYTWSLAGGVLPRGLSLSSAGVISGTPSALGTSRFTVRVTDHTGETGTQTLTLAVTGPGRFTPLPAARIFDSGAVNVGLSPVAVQLAGLRGVPANATAVVVTAQAASPTAAGYLKVTPFGQSVRVATQEFAKGQTISNLVVVKLNRGKAQVTISAGRARVVMDVAGYFTATGGSAFTPLPAARIFDSGAVNVGLSPVAVQLAGLRGVPANATAVVVTAQAASPTAAGYLKVTPFGQSVRVATQEFAKGQTISNLVVVKLNRGKAQVTISAGRARVVMDVAGYFTATGGSAFTPLPAARIFDSGAVNVGLSPVAVQLAGLRGVPANATAVVVTAQAASPTAAGYLKVTPFGQSVRVATQEFAKGQTISNLVVVKLNRGKAQVTISAGRARVVMDVAGYFR